MICQLCETPSTRLACDTCRKRILKHRWHGCARCGRLACDGCSHLRSFSRVRSLYTLQNVFAKWVSSAKDANQDWSIQLFEDVFIEPFKEIVYQTTVSLSVDYIVLAPFRISRLVDKPWHPILCLFDKMCLDERFQKTIAGIYIGTHRENFKMAHLKTSTRNNETLTQGFPSLVWDTVKFQERRVANRILIIDDVLTSGTTAKRCQTAQFPFEHHEKTDWLLQTLFRTPQSTSTLS